MTRGLPLTAVQCYYREDAEHDFELVVVVILPVSCPTAAAAVP